LNDIEAAAEALLLAYERCHHLGSYIDALRSALAHAARGEGEEWVPCRKCGAKVLAEGGGYCHGRYCASTPPPATGMKCWRDVEGTLPARRDGDKVARIDPETAIPATGKPWCRLCCGPHIGSDHVSTPYAAHPPATGEAGTHAMDVAERCFYAIKGGAPYRDSIRAMAAIIEAERPLPEAREGGG